MGKARKNSSDQIDVEDDDDDFSEEDKLFRSRQRDSKNTDDPKNKLRLGEFHRNNIKKKNRKPSLKKKLRDALRLA